MSQKFGIPVTQASDLIKQNQTSLKLSADVVVVGSGAGGAVMAYELAKKGKSVIILEAGPYVPSSKFTENMTTSLETLYQDKGNQRNVKNDVMVLQGSCVGGSTVINAGVCFRTPDFILDKWNHDYGLTNLTPKSLKPYFEQVEKNLSVHENKPHERNNNAHILERGADKLGLEHKPLHRNIKDCALTGFCLAGCVSDRKQSMLVSYLPWAIEKGAKIYADTLVTKIIEDKGIVSGVIGQVIDPRSKKIVSKIEVLAQKVVLAAGAIQTPLLLQKNNLANSSSKVGKNFACHPSTLILGEFEQPIYGWKGALSGSYVSTYMHPSKGGFLLASSMVGPVEIALATESGTGKTHLKFMKRIKYMAGINTLIDDQNHGEVTWNGDPITGTKKIDYEILPKDFIAVQAALVAGAKILFAAGAKKVHLPTYQKLEITDKSQIEQEVSKIKLDTNTLNYTSYHPQGTCKMGVNPKNSVVDAYGQSHDIKGLYIADGSILPSSIMVNPQVTIYALSSYIANNMYGI